MAAIGFANSHKPHIVDLQPHLPTLQRLTLSTWQVSLMLLGVVLALIVIAPALAPYPPNEINPSQRLLPPGPNHLFGTDAYGRDLLSRILTGAQLSLPVAIGAALIGALPGSLIGVVAAMRQGFLESLVTQSMDALMALPGLLVALAMVSAFGRDLAILAMALGFATLPMFYRIARAETLRLRHELFVTAARSLGASEFRVMVQHILPNITSTLIVLLAVTTGKLLLATSALSFIGLGAPPPAPEWGSLLAEGRDHMHHAWWLMWFPGAIIAFTTFCFYMLSHRLASTGAKHSAFQL